MLELKIEHPTRTVRLTVEDAAEIAGLCELLPPGARIWMLATPELREQLARAASADGGSMHHVPPENTSSMPGNVTVAQ